MQATTFPTLALVATLLLPAGAQRPKKAPQYKKNNRDQITRMANGETDKAMAYFKKYLAEQPGDLESHYALALGKANQGKNKVALQHLKDALAGGLHPGRFLAGPRTLNRELLALEGVDELLAGTRLLHGPLLGDLRPDGVRVWLRTATAADVAVRAGGQTFKSTSSAKTDYTAVVKIAGLEPGKAYPYEILIDGEPVSSTDLAGPASFRTLPASASMERLTIAFGGGAGYTPWFERMWDTIDAQQPDALLLLGDNVYIDTPTVRATQQYCYYRRQSQDAWRRLTSRTPVFAVWDDHDFGDNDCHGGPAIDEPAWKRPVWETFTRNWPNPSFGAGESGLGVWFAHRLGPVEFFFLDTRCFREKPKRDGSTSMLGPVQLAWLKQRLVASDAVFKVICSSVPMTANTKPGSLDTWDGHHLERDAIFDHIAAQKIEGVFILAADRHRSDLWNIPRPNAYDLTECMSSRLTNVHTHGVMPDSIFGYNKTCSFGLVRFDFSGDDPTATYEIRDIDGRFIYAHTIPRSSLRSKNW